MSVLQPPCFCYIVYKHMWVSPNADTSGHLSADEGLQEWRNLLDLLHVVHIPQGFCEYAAAIITNTVMVQARKNIHRKMDIKLLLFSSTSQARGKLQSHTYLHEPLQRWHFIKPQHNLRNSNTAAFHVAQTKR